MADPTECQQGVTNNCTQLCSRNVTDGTTTYECSCIEGYNPIGNLCDGNHSESVVATDANIKSLQTDIDECLNSSANNCSALNNEVCQNVEGSYTCDCLSGYQRNEDTELCEGTSTSI